MGQIHQKTNHVIVDIGETSVDSEYAIFARLNVSPTMLYSMNAGFEARDSIGNLY
jgi:hypothetical protein